MHLCPNCNELIYPGDIFCGKCGRSLPRPSVANTHTPTRAGVIICPRCGHINEPDSFFCENDGAPLSNVPAPKSPLLSGPIGVLIMPDQSEITLQKASRVFGRKDLIKYVKPENMKEVSRAHFTIIRESGDFYLQDGAPDHKNPQAWKPSANRTSINGAILEPGSKQKLNTNDIIDIAQLGLNLTFKTR